MDRMNPQFSVFNLHINDAGKRADKEFIAQFGQKKYDEVINPFRAEGIMSIFDEEPTIYTMAWVALCTAFANESAS